MKAPKANTAFPAAFAGLFVMAAASVQAACPTAETVGRGFFLEGSTARSEIRHMGDHFVQAKTRYSDGITQTDLYYEGLFAVSRVSQRGAKMMYNANLADWRLDLAEGATSSVTYVPIIDSKPLAETTLELEVKGREDFTLGDCSFTVHVISQTRKSGERSRQYDQLYAPLLKFVVARRYPNSDIRAYRGIEAMN